MTASNLDINTGGSKILVVDDQKENISLLREILKDKNYGFAFATSGEEALRIAKADPPDLILLDMVMSGLDGIDTCLFIKAIPTLEHIPIIFVTASRDVGQLVKAFEAGACDYITKPVHKEEVCVRIHNHLLTAAYSKALKSANETLKSMVQMDGLTGLPNRRYHEERFDEEWARMKREKKPLGVVMIDIDFFKQYNDHYGHIEGDRCLINVAKALQDVLRRPGDYVSRYGGEEFVAVLPNTDEIGVQHVAENMRAAVENLAIASAKKVVSPHVTASLGALSLIPREQLTKDEAMRFADTALYEAKESGRNKVVLRSYSDDEGDQAVANP